MRFIFVTPFVPDGRVERLRQKATGLQPAAAALPLIAWGLGAKNARSLPRSPGAGSMCAVAPESPAPYRIAASGLDFLGSGAACARVSICPPKTHEYAEAQRAPSVLRRVKAVVFIEDPPKVPRNLTARKLFATSIVNFDRALSKSMRRGRHSDDPASFLISLSCSGTAAASMVGSSTGARGSSGHSCTKGTWGHLLSVRRRRYSSFIVISLFVSGAAES